MCYLQTVEKIFQKIQTNLKSNTFKKTYFSEDSPFFTRKRNMPFAEMIAFLMQRSTTSMDIKIDKWFEDWMSERNAVVSRQAISKSRQHIPPEIFHDFLRLSVKMFKDNCKKKKSWNGYRILAIDGTDLQIPTTTENLSVYGGIKSRYKKQMAGATAGALFDVLNDIILDSELSPYKTCERKIAKKLLDTTMTEELKEESIVLFDRGYPAYEFLGYLFEKKINFVIRIKEQMTRLRDTRSDDGEVYRKCGNGCRSIRTIHLKLPTGTDEYLITNMPQEKLTIDHFQELYFLRWGIESKYKELKESIEVENFSGKKSICVKQDYFISLFLSNICSLIKQQTDLEISTEKRTDKEYQTRRKYLIYQMNKSISGVVLEKISTKKVLKDMVKKCKKIRSQIRRNRRCERNFNLNRRKYTMNHKTCI